MLRIKRYATYIQFGASTTASLATFDPTGYGKFAAFGLKCLSRFSDWLKKPPEATEALKEKIIGDLLALGELLPETRITVLIDDTDRLDPAESVEILRLIKAVANFPLVTYPVCFDRTILSAQVLEIIKVGSGEGYIEKIFQQIVPLPPQEPFALRRFARKQLLEYFPDEMVSAGRSISVQDKTLCSMDGLGGLLNSARCYPIL